MNITEEKIDQLNSILKVKLSPDDYSPKVTEALKKFSRKVNMPGFRPGMVPIGLVKKMYGKSILADELNRIVSESVDKYISEQKLNVLGNPLPNPANDIELNLEKEGDFEFQFDMGLAPEIHFDLPPAQAFASYDIQVADAELEEEIAKLRKRYGNFVQPFKRCR